MDRPGAQQRASEREKRQTVANSGACGFEAQVAQQVDAVEAAPQPETPAVIGSLATATGRRSSRIRSSARPSRRAPPPASTMPFCAMSAENSGGASSITMRTASTSAATAGASASRSSSARTRTTRSAPVTRSRASMHTSR